VLEREVYLPARGVGRERDADVLLLDGRGFHSAVELTAGFEAAEGVYADDPAVLVCAVYEWAVGSTTQHKTLIRHLYTFK